MSLTNIGDEIGKCIRIRQILELFVNGGAAYTGDGIIQLKAEADGVFDTDATSIRMHPTVIGFLNKIQNTVNQLLAECDQMTYAVWRNRVPVDINGVSLANDIFGQIGDFDNYLRDNTKEVLQTTPALGALTAGSTNTGTGIPVVDLLDTFNLNNQSVQDGADYWVTCTADAITGGTNQHQEQFQMQSSWPHVIPSITACMYPAADGSDDIGGGNRLQNEDGTTPGGNDNDDTTIPFLNFTANVPDGWAIDVGAAGVDIFDSDNSATYAHFGTTCLEFLGTAGAPLSEVSQDANDFFAATSTDQQLDPLAHYLIGGYMRNEAGITAGIVSIYMDGTGYTAGATEKATKDFSAAPPGATWTLYTGVVKMPKSIPSDMKAIVKATTAISDTHSVGIDGVFLAKMYHSEAMGINIAVVPSPTAFVADTRDPDRWEFASTNDWAGLWQEWFARRTDPRDITLFKYNDIAMHVNADGGASAELAETKCQ
jgi:hypothetical protein